MKTIILLILCPIISAYATVQASALDSTLLTDVNNLPLTFELVKNCGNWQNKDETGYYRLIVGNVYDGVGQEIYLQWIADPNPRFNTHAKLIKTLSFPELNNDHAQYSFQHVDCEQKGKNIYILATGYFEHDEHNNIHDISIKLMDTGRYELTEKLRPPEP